MIHDIMLPAENEKDSFWKIAILALQIIKVGMTTKWVLLAAKILVIAF